MQVAKEIFRQYDIRGVVGSADEGGTLNKEVVYHIGKALGSFYHRHGVKSVSVCRDVRLSSPVFKRILVKALLSSGIDVYDLGMFPTPFLYFSLFHLPVGGGVMITGSHNPPNENGFKICLGQTTIFGEQIQELREIIEKGDYVTGKGKKRRVALKSKYIKEVLKTLKLPAERQLKVVVDAGNGVANLLAVPLYRGMGHQVIELYSRPDGRFPNHHPDPTIPECIESLREKVFATGADMGLAFDGDGDRLGVIDDRGRILWGDQLMIIFARDILKDRPGAKFIGEVKCSQHLFDEITKAGGEAIMWKVGHSLIKAKLKEEDAVMAGEMSGHLFFADRYYGYDDAIYAGARLLEILAGGTESLSVIYDQLPQAVNTPEIRIACPEEKKAFVLEELAKEYEGKYPVVTIDGLRVKFPRGWGLVRASNTQPVLVLRFEAETKEDLDEIHNSVMEKVRALLA